MLDITFKQLEILNAVVVAGSVSKAARRIDISQPSVSQQLAKFEALIGCPLMTRSRGGGKVKLTPAGEYWFNTSVDILDRMSAHWNEHTRRFDGAMLMLNLGLTPTLRGRFVSETARIASRQAGLSKFEVTHAKSSAELVELLRLHKINCAVVTEDAILDDRSSFSIVPLFDDPLVWVVPTSVPVASIRDALSADKSAELPAPLLHFVDMDLEVAHRRASTDWFRQTLPAAAATFNSSSYSIAVDLVAAGMATTLCPTSLLAELPIAVKQAIRPVSIDAPINRIVLAVPKHLMSSRAYAKTFEEIIEFCHTEFADQVRTSQSELMQVG